MKTVLVTGPIGSGKSTACRYLESAGYPVYDCDSRCKALYDKVPGLRERIEQELGIPFAELGRIISDDAKRQALEALVYPLLVEDIQAWKAGQNTQLAFIESAIALEKPQFDGLYDEVLLVTAARRLRRSRNAKAAVRDSLQHFDRSRIDYTIHNASGVEALYEQIDKYLKKNEN
ncbi:MAG: dephospho-CoA kinase [Bacteroidales bacterium]|nr:dephospho-CoA kinase [Bacteroidales bacterium]